MIKTGFRHALAFRHARVRAAEALFRTRRAEILAAVVRQAKAGDRAAMGLARRHGLPVEPPPQVLAARLAESIERTRATVAMLLAEGGLDIGAGSRVAPRSPSQPTGPDRARQVECRKAAVVMDGNSDPDLYFPVNSEDEPVKPGTESRAPRGDRSDEPVLPC